MSHIFPVLGGTEGRKKERKRERERKEGRKKGRKKEREKKQEREERKQERKKTLQWNMVQKISAQPMTSAMNSRTACRMEATLILVPLFFATENCDMDPRRGGPHCGRLRGLPTLGTCKRPTRIGRIALGDDDAQARLGRARLATL